LCALKVMVVIFIFNIISDSNLFFNFIHRFPVTYPVPFTSSIAMIINDSGIATARNKTKNTIIIDVSKVLFIVSCLLPLKYY
jgi:hypothetical protein